MSGENPRYVAYARAHGRSTAAQLEQDRKDWPGGSMVGFTLWNTGRLRQFNAINPQAFVPSGDGAMLVDHAAYDQHLYEVTA
jgi:hypothetical protein